MSRNERSVVRVRLTAIDPPFQTEHQVVFGLQDKQGAVDAVDATRTTTFETGIELVGHGDADLDFRGVHVHGKKGDRFLYLSWGTADHAEPFVMFARAKIKLADIPTDLLQAADGEAGLECRVHATNGKGQPASGTIKHPAVSWHPGGRTASNG